MTSAHKDQRARCLYFDANGNKVTEPSQESTPTYDPWQALQQLEHATTRPADWQLA